MHPVSNRNVRIALVSRSRVQVGVKGGFIQFNHGKKAPLQKLRAGDGLIMYSPRTSYPDGEMFQSSTAIGVVTSEEIYQMEMTFEFKPFRVDVEHCSFKFAAATVVLRVLCLRLPRRDLLTGNFNLKKVSGVR